MTTDDPEEDSKALEERGKEIFETDGTADQPSEEPGESGEPEESDGSDRRARLNRALTVVLLIALVASLAGVVYISLTPQQTGEPFTEFYLYGPDGNATGYPTNLGPGESGTVIVGISNHERRTLDYRVEVTWNGTQTQTREITISDGNTTEFRASLTAPDRPGRYRVRFDLYVEGTDEVYQWTRLWIRVREPGNASSSIGPE